MIHRQLFKTSTTGAECRLGEIPQPKLATEICLVKAVSYAHSLPDWPLPVAKAMPEGEKGSSHRSNNSKLRLDEKYKNMSRFHQFQHPSMIRKGKAKWRTTENFIP